MPLYYTLSAKPTLPSHCHPPFFPIHNQPSFDFGSHYKMFSEELVQQEFYRLKNDITDLKNALDINRDILTIITSKKSTGDAKTDTLFRIINRLTKQSN
jgi:hypothetical protein